MEMMTFSMEQSTIDCPYRAWHSSLYLTNNCANCCRWHIAARFFNVLNQVRILKGQGLIMMVIDETNILFKHIIYSWAPFMLFISAPIYLLVSVMDITIQMEYWIFYQCRVRAKQHLQLQEWGRRTCKVPRTTGKKLFMEIFKHFRRYNSAAL